MERYIIVDGKKVLEKEFYKNIAINQARNFAYDSQLSLFPEAKVEQARKDLREKFDKGEPLEVIILNKSS